MTHGFTVDEKGRKMSKSLGNTLDLDEALKTYGAEILRLWVVSCDYTDDLRIGKELLKHQQDIYRRYRNTLRYLLGALSGGKGSWSGPVSDMPALEQWVLHRLSDLEALFMQADEAYSYPAFYATLHSFCASDLSAFYFDIRKDRLYCDALDDPQRQATLFVMAQVLEKLTLWLLPVLPFTAQEVWEHLGRPGMDIHTALYEATPSEWKNHQLAMGIEQARDHRRLMTTALERARADSLVGSSLQGTLTLYDPENALNPSIDYAEWAIVSGVTICQEKGPGEALFHPTQGWAVIVNKAPGHKCDRCWKILPTVEEGGLCSRCLQVTEGQ
jgi:isoleucyl-tRNA synthetase